MWYTREELINEEAAQKTTKRAGWLRWFLIAAVLISALIFYRNIRVGSQESPAGTSGAYKGCEARVKPKFESCLEVQPEENWGACRAAYLDELDECTIGE